MAASHILSLCQSFRALRALASDDLDGITNGLDDLVALQDLSLTSKRTALLDVKITVQATECWRDRFEGRISNAAAYAELGPCFRRCTTLLASDFTSDWAQDMSTLDRVPGDLRLLQQSLTTEVVTECLTEFQGRVSKCWGNLWEACDTQGPGALATETAAAEGFRACVPAAHQTPRHPCRVGHDRPRARRAEGREVLSAGTANIFGRLSFRQTGQRHGRLDDEVHFVRECGGRSTPQCSLLLMEEAGKLVRTNEDATKLTDIARDMNHVLAQQKAEKWLLLLEKAQEMIGSKSALAAVCTLTGGDEKLSGSTVEQVYPENSESAACDQLRSHCGNRARGNATSRTRAHRDRQCKGSRHVE